jgi:hypothetical protein
MEDHLRHIIRGEAGALSARRLPLYCGFSETAEL